MNVNGAIRGSQYRMLHAEAGMESKAELDVQTQKHREHASVRRFKEKGGSGSGCLARNKDEGIIFSITQTCGNCVRGTLEVCARGGNRIGSGCESEREQRAQRERKKP